MTTLRRISHSNFGTFGALLDDGDAPLCFTCEEPWKGNAPLVSCVPAGAYRCVRHSSARFPNVWEITGVPHRSAILIHAGNTIKDTHGCVLVGTSFIRHPDYSIYGVAESRKALDKLRGVLPDEFPLVIEAAP